MIDAYAGELQSPFFGDCSALTYAAAGFCLAADREVDDADAYFRVCRVSVDVCFLVESARRSDGSWRITSVTRYGGSAEIQLAP